MKEQQRRIAEAQNKKEEEENVPLCKLCKPINDPNPINVKPISPPSLLEVEDWDSKKETEYRKREELQWREETAPDGYYPPSPIYDQNDKSDPLPPCTMEEKKVLDPDY